MKSHSNKKITVLIPCYNEEEGVGAVINGFPRETLLKRGFDLDVIVIDNNSSDKTSEVARACGATVLHESKKGKGNAIRKGFNSIKKNTDYVVMLDGDNSYHAEEILRLIEPLESGTSDVVIGSRLRGTIGKGSMSTLNRAGNIFFTTLVSLFYQVDVTDVLTGYFAWNRKSLEKLRSHLVSEGFAIEMEMVTKIAHLKMKISSVPITYTSRSGETNLRPFYDGSRILWMFAKNLFWNVPKEKIQRIAFVSDSVLPYFNGGKERRLYEISRRLVKSGREVHIYTMKWWDGPKTIVNEGVFFHAITKLHPLYHNERRSIGEAILFGLGVFKLLFEKFDVLDVDHMPVFPLFSARIVTWVRGKKLFATWHEVWGSAYWQEYLPGFSGDLAYILESISYKLPDTIIANSLHTANRLYNVGVTCEVKTVSLGADLKSIYAAKPAFVQSDVIYVGRLLSHKGVDILVNAIKLVKDTYPDIKVVIIGNGPEKSTILNLIAHLNLKRNITLIDEVKNSNDLYGFMKTSKMLVLPSIREGFGLVVVEANAAGIPVITTKHKDNAAKDLVYEGINGFLSDPTEEAIAEKILMTLEVGDRLQPRHNIEKHDWRIVVQGIENAFA